MKQRSLLLWVVAFLAISWSTLDCVSLLMESSTENRTTIVKIAVLSFIAMFAKGRAAANEQEIHTIFAKLTPKDSIFREDGGGLSHPIYLLKLDRTSALMMIKSDNGVWEQAFPRTERVYEADALVILEAIL